VIARVCISTQLSLYESCVSLISIMMSFPKKQPPFKEPLSPIGRTQSGLAESYENRLSHQVQKEMMEMATDLLMINRLSTRGSHQAQPLQKKINNGEHTLIPVTAKMIQSAVSACKSLF
jgi:hypothetical protein